MLYRALLYFLFLEVLVSMAGRNRRKETDLGFADELGALQLQRVAPPC